MRPRHPLFLMLGTCLAGGMLGALAGSVALWAAGAYGLADWAGVALHPKLAWPWLRPRLLWGGLWGIGFVPVAWAGSRRLLTWGILYGLLPSAVQLFYVFPELLGKGTLGAALGSLTPAFVIGANAVYGWVLALWVRMSVTYR
ncbi:MAG: hypothetical protein Kow0092_19450 [Deferrisomatales bacterium]